MMGKGGGKRGREEERTARGGRDRRKEDRMVTRLRAEGS